MNKLYEKDLSFNWKTNFVFVFFWKYFNESKVKGESGLGGLKIVSLRNFFLNEKINLVLQNFFYCLMSI